MESEHSVEWLLSCWGEEDPAGRQVNKLSQLLAVEVRGAPLHSLPLQQLTCFPDLQELEEVLRHSLLCWKIVREARPIVSKFNPAAQKEGKSGHKGGFLRLLVVG